MAQFYKVLVTLCGHENGLSVYFKQDGQRFEHPLTLKLNTNTDYDLKFTFKPGMNVHKLMINGEKIALNIENSKLTDDDDSKTYVAKVTTEGFEHNERTKRKNVLIVTEFEKGEYLKLCLQCKMYKFGETRHAQWGQILAAVDLDCKLEQGHTYATILEEKYL